MPDLQTVSFTYDGPLASVAVKLPTGRVLERAIGETVDAFGDEIQALDDAPGWTRTADEPADKADTATPADTAKKEGQK